MDRARACGLDLLRKVVDQHTLDQALSETGTINADIRKILDIATHEWGVEATLVELEDIQLPDSEARDGSPSRRLLDGQTPWGPCNFGAANRSSPSDSSRRERCILVFGVITTASRRMGTLVRPREACAGVEYVGAARVSRRFTRLGRSTTGRHRPKVCARTPTASQFPESVAPPTVSFVTVDSPASRKRPVAICKRSPPVTCLHPRLADSYRVSTVGLTPTESRA